MPISSTTQIIIGEIPTKNPRNTGINCGLLVLLKNQAKSISCLADGEGFEPPEELPLQRFSRPSHSTALPPIRNCFKPLVFQTCGFVCGTSSGDCARIFYIYFLRIATVKIVAPATNIIADNNCPIVRPQLVKKPIWTSGARNCSQNMRATAYPIPSIPPKAPA